MKCEVCGQGPMHNVSIYRNNPKGEKAVWRCEVHLDRKPDPNVAELVGIIESGSKDAN